MDMNILSPKIGNPTNGPQRVNWSDFLEKDCNDFDLSFSNL
jgi:hypothetical protein